MTTTLSSPTTKTRCCGYTTVRTQGLPVAGFDFTSSLGLTDLSGGLPREVDIEASIRQGNRIFWIGSQSNKELGPARPNRDRVFATDISGTGASTTLSYVGRYDYLKEDIINWDATNGHSKGANYYGLQTSADAATNSKAPEGYNIEGAELAPDGTTAYIGFRAPQVLPANRTKALIVAVTNLTSLVNGSAQGSATFGAPIELDLGGRGIREIRKNTNNDYIIIAGPAGDAGAAPNDFRLYTWTGNAADSPVLRTTDLTALNVNGGFESIVDVPNPLTNTSPIQLLVDNGDAIYYNDGQIAKDLPVAQNNFKKFRSDIVTLGAAPNTAPTVANVVPPQSATVNVGYALSLASVFTDAETPSQLTLTVSSLPAGLSFTAPATLSGTPSTTVGSPVSITVTATDPGSLSVSTNFSLTVNPAVVNPNAPFSITGVTTVSCTTLSAGQRQLRFTPQYAGLNGQPVSFSVVNELLPTTAAGPYTLNLYIDNPTITLKATQTGTAGEASFSYNWLAVCNGGGTPPTNTAPTTTGIANQTATVNQYFSLNVAPSFSDSQTPNALVYSATGLPDGLSLTGGTISGTPSASSVSSVTVTATDPGSLSVSTNFSLTVNPAVVNPNAPFSITGVTTVSCTTLSAGQRQLRFTPQYAGLNGQPVSFSVVNELLPTTAAGPYTLNLYIDNPTITLKATQTGTAGEASFSYNWLAVCNGGGTPPTNTAPTTTGIANQTATVNQYFSLNVASSFSDSETPNALVYSATGLPGGLSLTGSTLSGTPSASGVSGITVTASDPGSLSVSTSFSLTVSPAVVNPTAPFSITGVTTVSCETISTGERRITFTPRYAGLNSQPISFSVVNELLPTTAPGPYALRLYTDNPVINLRATQTGTAGEASFAYNWLAACGASQGRQGVVSEEGLRVIVLGNPIRDDIMQVDIRGAGGQPLRVQIINQQGKCIAETSQEQAADTERIRLRIGSATGIYLLQVSTPTQQKTIRLLRQ